MIFVLQEVAVLARCDCANITRYFASVLRPGSSELYIVMELMAVSVADLVSTYPSRPCTTIKMQVLQKSLLQSS